MTMEVERMVDKFELKVKSIAPKFTLKDQGGNDIVLGSFKGQKILLSFHPLAWTGICAKQMKSLEDNFKRFSKLNVVPLGMSIDTVPSKKAWAEHLDIKNVRLLSDFWPHGKVAKKYKLFREVEGFSQRANILIDEDGKIAYGKIYELSVLPDIEEIISHIQGES